MPVKRVRAGRVLFLAGDEALLRRLPRGEWVGGTSDYFLTDEGGMESHDRICAWEVPAAATGHAVRVYDARSVARIYADGPRYERFAWRPLIGWVSGVALPDVGKVHARVFDGREGRAYEDAAVVLSVCLPRTMAADVDIVNIFEPGDGDDLAFPTDGFVAREVLVGGRPTSFARYIEERRLDTRLPLVADYNGAMVNISFQSVDAAAREVRFYAPVFRGVRYRHARPVGDYVQCFVSQLPADLDRVVYSCNCILNYVHARLEGRRTPGFVGPATFGEIAYQLVNQTLVYLRIGETNLAERLRTDTAVRRQLRALEAETRELDAFAAMVSHDLRRPLRHIRTFAEVLENNPAVLSDAQALHCAERITVAAARMSELLDDPLTFSRAGRAPLQRERVDLGALVEAAREDLASEQVGRAIEWEVGPLPVVLGDPALLRQVFVNLLSNAVKYSRDRPVAHVTVRGRTEEGRAVVTVQDDGVGFDPAESERLFRPFARLATADGHPGTGMGLAIVERIVARHGGSVRAEGRPGVGARFTVALPVG